MDSVQSNDNMVVVARRSPAITLYYGKKLWFGMISNQITKFKIKSKSNHTFSKSNHYAWFNHDL